MEECEDVGGDETISLSDVLVARDSHLPEDELWALCRECCLVLEVVNSAPDDQFQTLGVTPDTVAFDQVGNVCFLDLDADPEPIYLAPEYSSDGNSYTAHLFSLGMTLLYAAEYNGDHTQDVISQELKDLLGRMTADSPTARPDLESTIILCEEQLCGQSSQEVCCGIAAIAGFGLSQEEGFEEPTVSASNFSPEEFSHAETFVHSEYDDTTCCDDIPDLTEDVSQAESFTVSDQGIIVSGDLLDESFATNSEETDMESSKRSNRHKPSTSSSHKVGNSGQEKSKNQQQKTVQPTSENINNKPKPDLPKKPDSLANKNEVNKGVPGEGVPSKAADVDLVVSELQSESDTDHSRKSSDKSQTDTSGHRNNNNASNGVNSGVKSGGKGRSGSESSGKKSGTKDVQMDKNQNITNVQSSDREDNKKTSESSGTSRSSRSNSASDKQRQSEKERTDSVSDSSSRTKRSKRKQGMTITEILESLDRHLKEEELWALCKEGTAALQRKKKHLPAYLSPDTLLIRESGNVSFKAIPEEKPLEVIFMAPELQAKGELSEKTCLFGLSVTLRCAAGKKYSSVSAMPVDQDLKDLLQYLVDTNPVKRPELSDIIKVCNEQSNGTSSDTVCARLFQDVIKAQSDKEERQLQEQRQLEQQQKSLQQQQQQRASPPAIAKPSAFKPTGGSAFQIQPVKPAPIGSNSGAFCPIPKKSSQQSNGKENEIPEPRIPSAFSSPATHFKPIVLHQTAAAANEKPAPVKEEKAAASKDTEKDKVKPVAPSVQKTTDNKVADNPNDSDKEVVKKLKELKKNLMKHRQPPTMVKEIEDEDKPPAESSSSKPSETATTKTAPEKPKPRKSLPDTPKNKKKSSSSSIDESKEKKKEKKEEGEALNSLLKEIQKQGNVPDTQSLASAIAGYLKGHLKETTEVPDPKEENQLKNAAELDMTVTSAQSTLTSEELGRDVEVGQILPNLNIPSQFHSQLLGQTMTLPGQFGGSVISGLPQFQFQQDPVTGYLQLVPVVMRPHSVHSNSNSIHSNSGGGFASPAGSSGMKETRSPHISSSSPKAFHNQSDNINNLSAISDSSGSKVKGNHGRTARDLVQKTANLRAKNMSRPTPSPHLLVGAKEPGGLQKWKSDHTLDNGNKQFYSENADPRLRQQPNSASSLSFQARHGYDDSMINNSSSLRNAHSSGRLASYPNGGTPQYRSPDNIHHRQRPSHSNSSSPSPSKDSGVSGMNMGIQRGMLPPGTDASLMERLLSNVNMKQQKVLGRIVHLVREEFAFDGYMENGVEDVAMAEYISSLGALKWETFTSAICEKYSDLYWGDELLSNLFRAVNGSRPPSGGQQSRTLPRRSHGQRANTKRGGSNDDSSGLSDHDENSRNRTHDRLQSQLSPLAGGRPRSAYAASGRKPLDTSDSTDSENYGKRRRVKTKHELDRMKSNSSSNLIADNASLGTTPKANVSRSERHMIAMQPEPDLARVNVPGSQRSPVGNPPSGHGLTDRHPGLPDRHLSVDGSLPSPRNHANSSHLSSSFDGRPRNTAEQNGQLYNPHYPTHPATAQNQAKMNGLAGAPGIPGYLGGEKGVVPGAGLSREVSVSSHSSSQSDAAGREGEAVTVPVEKKGHVVYHWSMIQLSMTTEMERFMQDIDEGNCKMLLTKLATLDQQLKMERRGRKKSQKYYKNLLESHKNILVMNKNEKATKGEQTQMFQVVQDITEMTQRIRFIDLCKTHIQMLLAELQGIDVSYLYSIAVCPPPGGPGGPGDQPLHLQPRPDNPALQFQTLREPHTGCEIQALHAGTPEGLMAYLFASTALSEGFIHQFLFCYRYFTTPMEVLNFLIHRYIAAARAGSTETNIVRLQKRVIDVLHFWLEGYFSIDFQGRKPLVELLRRFIKEHIKEDSDGGQSLLALLSNCSAGNNLELSSADPDEPEMHFWQREEPKMRQGQNDKKTEWDSFKSLIRGGKSGSGGKDKVGKVKISAVCVERRRRSAGSRESAPSGGLPLSRRTDMFTLGDYTAQCLAEQLCLIEQGVFQLTHPVHYLDSKFRGVGVELAMSNMRTPAPTRRHSAFEGPSGLFVEPLYDSTAVQEMIEHAHEVSHWVSAEIVSCSNPKTQVAVLSKFLSIAHLCTQLRNFATGMAVLDGLENLIVKQLPAWKSLPTKSMSIIDELEATRMFLKNDPLSLMQQGRDCHLYPTIPSAVVFLLHVQQLEIGGFTLANQMYKWGKIRTIAQVIDQVRVFREHMYGFEAAHDLQETLRQRVHSMQAHDIHELAAQHDINYQKTSSASGISGAFKKMKGKLK